LQHLEHFIDMSLRGTLREEDVTDNSLHVDDVRHAPCSPKAVGTRLADHIGIATTTSTLLRHLMLVDQAGWHQSKELQVPANIRLIEQPAYSPEVNPVKHVWEELR
jgi:hypothetical protein